MSHLRPMALVLALGALFAAPAAAADGNYQACDPPAQVIDLSTNWKLQLPVDDPNQSGTQPREIKYPALSTFTLDPWFVATSACDGIRFRNPVNSVTTSTDGTHTMVIDQAITHLPNTKPHVVAGQIHGEINAYYNGELETTIPVEFTTGYFKAGVYTQANCTNSQPCSASNYGEVVVYDVTVTHES